MPRTSTEVRFFPPQGISDLGIRKEQGLPAGPERSRGTDHLSGQHGVSEVETVSRRDCERDEVIEGSGLHEGPAALGLSDHVNSIHSTSMSLLSLEFAGPTLTVNNANKMHWSERSKIIAFWREQWGWLGLTTRVQLAQPVGIEVRVFGPKVGGQADAAGHVLLAKAAIDGLVDGKVLKADDGMHVLWSRYWAPFRADDVPKGMVRLAIDLVGA